MLKTAGLSPIHLYVKDVRRSIAFYRAVFGMQELFWHGEHAPGHRFLFIEDPDGYEIEL